MIRHIVFFTISDPASLRQIKSGLERLGTIPGSQHFEVKENRRVDLFGNDIDLVVYAEFADEAALHAYKAHPTYDEVTRRVRPLRELRFAADIEADPPRAVAIRRTA